MLVIGILLVVDPLGVTIWPWTLTDLTGRAIGAWLLSLAIAAFQVAWEGGLRRTRAATTSYLLLAALQLIAVARYTSRIDFDSPETWVYVTFLLSMAAAGIYLFVLQARVLPINESR